MQRIAPWVGVSLALLMSTMGGASLNAETVKTPGTSPELQTSPAPSGWVILEKLGRGLGNIAFGWVEIPGTIQQQYREHDAPASFFSGLLIGGAKALGRTAVGVYETVTFVLPQQAILPPMKYFKREHPDWKLPK